MHENKWLYKVIHKKHHEFKATSAVATLYAHPVETFFVTLGKKLWNVINTSIFIL